MLSLLSVLVGAVLGLRFRVLVLVPAIGCAILASSFFSHDLAHGALASLFAVIGLQIYLGGIVTRHVMVLARASRMRTRSQRQRTSPSLS